VSRVGYVTSKHRCPGWHSYYSRASPVLPHLLSPPACWARPWLLYQWGPVFSLPILWTPPTWPVRSSPSPVWVGGGSCFPPTLGVPDSPALQPLYLLEPGGTSSLCSLGSSSWVTFLSFTPQRGDAGWRAWPLSGYAHLGGSLGAQWCPLPCQCVTVSVGLICCHRSLWSDSIERAWPALCCGG
jgi:hypothetical protein